MKKFPILALVLLSFVAISSTSCNKNCKGGGWYGNRNLGHIETPQKSIDAVKPVSKIEEEANEICNP